MRSCEGTTLSQRTVGRSSETHELQEMAQMLAGLREAAQRLPEGPERWNALREIDSLHEEPFSSCLPGRGSPPLAATGFPSPIRAVSEQHLHAMLSLVRRTG